VARLTVGGIAGILLLAALTVLLAASIRRIIVSYRDQRKVDVVAVVGLVVVLLVFVCSCLILLGPTIGEWFDLTTLPD
jgi:intracellular septation protein A